MPYIDSNCRKCGAEIEVQVPSTFTGGPGDVHHECRPCEVKWEKEFAAEHKQKRQEEPEVIYRPARPLNPVGWPMGPDSEHEAGAFYTVTQSHRIVAAFYRCYYRSVSEVTAELQPMFSDYVAPGGFWSEAHGKLWSGDFAIWASGRLLATIHQTMDGKKPMTRITLHREEGNDPAGCPAPYCFPSYEQWVADGRDKIILQPKPEDGSVEFPIEPEGDDDGEEWKRA